MNGKDALRKIIDDFLKDDRFDRDIVLLANQMGIDVIQLYTKADFVAYTEIDKDKKIIFLNKSRVNDSDLSRFILAYQLAEYVKDDGNDFYSLYEIDKMQIDCYLLARDIVNRRNKYKKGRVRSRKFN